MRGEKIANTHTYINTHPYTHTYINTHPYTLTHSYIYTHTPLPNGRDFFANLILDQLDLDYNFLLMFLYVT